MNVVLPSADRHDAPCDDVDDLDFILLCDYVVFVSEVQMLSLDSIQQVRAPRIGVLP